MSSRKLSIIIIPILLSILTNISKAGEIRVGGGIEAVPFRFADLDEYDIGYGTSLNLEYKWGGFLSTSFEFGYRKWNHSEISSYSFHLYRFGVIHKLFPLYNREITYKPYVGIGITFNNEENFSLGLKDSDYGGLTILSGCYFPLYNNKLYAEPNLRWELDFETDYAYSYLSVGVNLVLPIRY